MMGIHSPFRYTGYEQQFLETFINLLDMFCSGCHTNADYDKKCYLCPVGNLILESKGYLLEAYESDDDNRHDEIIKDIKDDIKSIYPEPGFNGTWITDKIPKKDVLDSLRWSLACLRYEEDSITRGYRIHRRIDNSAKMKEILKAGEDDKQI